MKAENGKIRLSPFEKAMYMESRMNPDSDEYLLNLLFEISGVTKEALEEALTSFMLSHEAWHSFYTEEEGEPFRVLTDELPSIRFVEGMDRSTAEKMCRSYHTPLPLDRVPLRLTGYILDRAILLHIAIHHIAMDGGSIRAIMEGLMARFKGEEPLNRQRDLSDISWFGKDWDSKESKDFYRQMFEGGIPVNEMPLKQARPKIHPQTDRLKELTLKPQSVAAIRLAAKEYRVTVFEFLFSAVSIVLGRYSGSSDLVLGVPVDLRKEEDRSTVGMFVNTAPVRTKPERDKPLSSFLTENAEMIRAATREFVLPFAEVVEEFVSEPDSARHPVFDAGINYLRLPEPLCDAASGISIAFSYELQRLRRDLNLTIYRENKVIRIIAQYPSALFEDGVIERFLEQLEATLSVMTQKEKKVCISQAAALPENQKEELKRFSISEKTEIPEKLLHRMFEGTAVKIPDKTALIACDRTLTFTRLNEEANRIAWSLLERGVKKGDSIILLLPRRSFYFSALFGVLKAGAAFIPCDPAYPSERIRLILEDCGAAFLISTKDQPQGSVLLEEKRLNIEELLKSPRSENPETEVLPEDLAYLIYTSGSTGKPKGVMIRHLGIANYCTANPANPFFDIVRSSVETMLSVTTVSFDMSLKDTVGVMLNGKTVVFADESKMNDPRALCELICTHGADAVSATPSRYREYLEYRPFAEALSDMKLIAAGGESLSQGLLKSLQSLGNARILNTYGPTEITVSSNMAELTKAALVTNGRPILNVLEYIVDKNGSPVPIGVKGELLIGGPGVAAGYRGLIRQGRWPR